MKSALLLLFIPPIMSWSNSSHSHAIQKDTAACIQVTTAGITELTADVCPETHLPGAHGRAKKEGANPPEMVTHLNLPKTTFLSAHPPLRILVRVSRYWTALCIHRAMRQRKINKRSRRTTAARGRQTYACNQKLSGFIPLCIFPVSFSLHPWVLKHCRPIFW